MRHHTGFTQLPYGQLRAEAGKRKAFTLIELLVVVAIIALLVAILLPSLGRARELAKRTVCAANNSSIGKAMYVYANENTESFPIINGAATVDWFNKLGNYRDDNGDPNGAEYASTFATSAGVSIDMSLWLLIQTGSGAPKLFNCPSSDETPDNLRQGNDTQTYSASEVWGFRDSSLSYSYQIPYSVSGKSNAAKPSTNLDARMAVLADLSPYITNTGAAASPAPGNPPTAASSYSNAEWEPYNSKNHNEEGQNVLFADSHAEFVKKPAVGIGDDNIYTGQTTGTQSPWAGTAVTSSAIIPQKSTDSVLAH